MENSKINFTRQRKNNNNEGPNWTGVSMSLKQLMQMQSCGLDVKSNEDNTKTAFICGEISGPVSQKAVEMMLNGNNNPEDYQVSQFFCSEEQKKKYGEKSYMLVPVGEGAGQTIASFSL